MGFNEYQSKAKTTDLGIGNMGEVIKRKSLNVPEFLDKVLGLTGESGELADKVKKIMRDKQGEFTEDDRAEILKELGDVLWYVSEVALYLDTPLSEVAEGNIKKLSSRKQRGKLQGEGDNR